MNVKIIISRDAGPECGEKLFEVGGLLLKVFQNRDLVGEFTGEEHFPDHSVFYVTIARVQKSIDALQHVFLQCDLLNNTTISREESGSAAAPIADATRVIGVLKRRPSKPRYRKPQIGEYYAIPLPNGRFGYARFIYSNRHCGDLVQVLDAFTTSDKTATLDDLKRASPLFPPVITSVTACVENGGWRKIGRQSGELTFDHPVFRSSICSVLRGVPGQYHDWLLCDKVGHSQYVGHLLPEHLKYEYDTSWLPDELAKRIVTGTNPYDAWT